MSADIDSVEPVESKDADSSADSVAKGYLTAAGLPGGLLLFFGSRSVLKSVSNNETYQKEAPETLTALAWMQGMGFAIAVMALMALLASMRKVFWRRR
jgi:hypothetical protein